MEKITKSLLALMLMLVGLVSAKAGDAPVPPKAPDAPAAPKASALVTDGSVQQYLYNVGAKGFFIGANDWGTRASISTEKGYWVKMTANGETFTLTNEAKGGNAADCQGVDQIWVDGAGRAGDGLWTVTIADDLSFKLGNTNVAGFLSVLPSKNDTKLYMSDADEAQNVWIAVSEADYAAYQEAIPAYQEAVKQYNEDYAQYQKDYAAWLKENYKAGEDISALAPADWTGQGGNYTGLANPAKEKYVDGANAPLQAGDVMTQTIDGLKNGKYIVKLEAAGSYTSGRGFECPTGDGLAVAFANNKEENLPIVDRGWVGEGEQNFYALEAEVTDGTLKYGVKNLAAAGNWYVIRLASITMVPGPDAWYTGADFFRFRADKNASAESPYIAYKDKVEPAWGADPDDPANGCIVCKVPANVNPASQIWIRGTEAGKTIANGSKEGFKVTFRVKADGEYKGLESQAHDNWGYKTGGSPFGTLDVTTEWQTVSFVCTGEKAKADFTDLCFNISGDAERTFYFDDVKIVRGGAEWYLSCGEIHAKDYQNPAATYTDSDDPHPFARFVSDADGDYVEVITNAGRTNPWDSQIWIGIPEEFVGKTTKMTMQVWATKAVKCPESYHATATGKGWGASASPGQGLETKVGEWVEITRILNTKDVNCNGVYKNMQVDYYCLDLSNDEQNTGSGITYKFKDIKFEQAQQDWYTAGKIIAKDYVKGDEVYTNSDTEEFPLARYIYDDGGDYVEVQSNANRVDEWDSQIWIEIPEAWVGKKVKLTMEVEASKEVTAAAAYHSFAGGNHWGPSAGDGVPFKVGEFTKIDRILNTKEVTCNKGEQVKYYVLNLSNDEKGEGTGITYKFKNITWSEAPVDTWADLIPLQDFEAGYTGADDEKLYFFEKEQEISSDTYRARIVDGVGKDGGKAIEFRYAENAEQGWYSQFEIRLPYLLPNGTKIKLTADIKADKAASGLGGQVWYNDFGSYRGGIPGYALEADTWYKYEKEITINDGEANDDPKGLRFLVFDGKGGSEANILYFDNISVQIAEDQVPAVDPDFLNATDFPIFEYVDPSTLDWSENILKNGDLSTNDMSEFILKNNDVENPEMLLAEKNEYGEIGIETAALPAEGGNDYDAQFFVRLPKVLPKGKKFNLEFDLYAEHINTLTIAAHGEPGEWKANISSVKTDPAVDAVHYQEYLTAPADMRTIAFNLAVADATTYGFSNIKVQYVNDDEAAIEEATQTADATTLWAETLALNEACYAGRITETEGYTAESVKALTDAIAAGKAALAPAEGDPAPTKESLTAAAKAITDAIAGLKKDAPALAYTDLTKEMFFHWNAADETAEPIEASNCDFNIGTSTGQPYGLSTVNHDRFADLSAYNTIELTATEGEPRLLFNRIENEGTVFAEVPRDKDKYETVVDNGDGSKTYVIDIAAIVAEYGFAHLHAIKGANWANTTVTEIKLGYAGEKPALPIPTAIEGVETAEDALQDGKYFINGQIVIVKNGVKYNAAGVAIK